MEEYLNTPVSVRLIKIEPIYFPLVTEIFQRGLGEDPEFPAVFDYRETDKESKEQRLLVSFAVTKNSQGLTVKKVKGKERKKLLADMDDLNQSSRK